MAGYLSLHNWHAQVLTAQQVSLSQQVQELARAVGRAEAQNSVINTDLIKPFTITALGALSMFAILKLMAR